MARNNRQNRLSFLFGEMANSYELPHTIDHDNLGAEIGVPVSSGMVFVNYVFDESEEYYDFGAALLNLRSQDVASFSEKILRSEAIPGITERITEEDKLYVSGTRNGLSGWGNEDVKYGYMDDLARIAEAYEQYKQQFGE